MTPHLLLVEDDKSLGATLQERLVREGYQVEWAQTLAQAQESYSSHGFDLVILDISLPDGSGFEMAHEINTRAVSRAPFIFMTALNSAENRLQGYEAGADEFIPKPFHLKELLLRVQHVLEMHKPVAPVVHHQRATIDLAAMQITLSNGEKMHVSARDFYLLRLLIEKAPKVISRAEILDAIWGADRFPSTRTVDNAVVRLRQLLGDECIRSVRGVGYQWTGERGQPV